jgi:hypothetical protein
MSCKNQSDTKRKKNLEEAQIKSKTFFSPSKGFPHAVSLRIKYNQKKEKMLHPFSLFFLSWIYFIFFSFCVRVAF